jgi:anti-anti-sigma factor
MRIDIKNDGGAVTVTLSGRLDVNSSLSLQRAFDEMPEIQPETNVTLDFSGVDYISSAGLRVLLLLQKKFLAAQSSLTISNLSDGVRGVFDMMGFSSIFEIA